MILRQPFVAAPVVSGDACHDLLLLGVVCAVDIGEEFRRGVAAQRGRQLAAMMHEYFAALRGAEGESEIVAHARSLGCREWPVNPLPACAGRRQTQPTLFPQHRSPTAPAAKPRHRRPPPSPAAASA